MYHMFGAEAAVKNRVAALEYDVNKEYFWKQLVTARLYTPRLDYKRKAKVFQKIVSRLMQIERIEQKEVPAIKSFFVRVLLKRHEPRETLHDQYADEIGGLNRSLSPYEEERGGKRKRQAFDPWGYMELPDRHVRLVHQYLATEELGPPSNDARTGMSPRIMTARSRRDFVRSYLGSIRTGVILGDGVMSTGSDSGSESGSIPFARFYHRELEHMINGVLPLLQPDDIDFAELMPSTDISDSEEDSVMQDSSTDDDPGTESELEDARISEDIRGPDRVLSASSVGQGSRAGISEDVRDADGGDAPPESFVGQGSCGESDTSPEPEMEDARMSEHARRANHGGAPPPASSVGQRSLCESCTDSEVEDARDANHRGVVRGSVVVDLTYESD